MDNKLILLYRQIKEGKINRDEALKQIKELKTGNGSADISEQDLSRSYEVTPEMYIYDAPFLKDHTVYGKQVLIGVTHGSLAVNAYFKLFPKENSGHLSKLNFINPIEVKKDQRVEVLIKPDFHGEKIDFNAMYRYQSSDGWDLSATGSLQKAITENKHADIGSIRSLLEEYPDVDRIYRDNPAVVLGDSFKTITRAYRGKDTLLARVALSQVSLEEKHDYVLHPLIINSAFLAVFPLMEQSDNRTSFLPFGIKDIYFSKTSKLDKCWVLVKLVRNSGEMVIFDADVIDDDFQIVASCCGCSIKRLRTGEFETVKANAAPVESRKQRHAEASSHSVVKPDTEELSEKIQKYLTDKLSKMVDDPSKLLNQSQNLMDIGLGSSQLMELTNEIQAETNIELNPTLFFEYPNINELAGFFSREHRDYFMQSTEVYEDQVAAYELYGQKHDSAKPKMEVSPNSQNTESVEKRTETQTLPEDQKADRVHSGTIKGVLSGEDLDLKAARPSKNSPREPMKDDIAVIGIHGMFAGASNLDGFWGNLRDRKDLITEIPADHWDYRPWYDENQGAKDKTYCKWGSFIDDVDKFDAGFFNISPREADWMDPQLRLLLQSVYAAGEDAGYINRLKGTDTGVFVGVCFHDYADRISELNLAVDPYEGTGNAQTVIANRISFLFNLKGPSVTMDTACSSSLFALHYACLALQNKECSMAFVGGANLLLSSWHYRYFSSISALSPTGRCHSFDAAADGYIPGEGIGSILIKPLQQAKMDGDRIYAVIKGSAALHGGYTPSLTAPSVEGEENVILKAWEAAGIQPETISYIEAHGTGTKLGDPIEINSLKKAFKRFTEKEHFCAVGSVKSSIGHTEGAAGIAGILKVIMQMKYRQIPAMTCFKELNPYIRLDESALYINRETEEWKSEDGVPRRAGISSFGFSGSYAHVVLEEYIADGTELTNVITNVDRPALIVLSAKNEERLREVAQRLLAAMVELNLPDSRLADMAYTLQVGREAMEERLAVLARSVPELEEKLKAFLDGRKDVPNLYHNQVKRNRETVAYFTTDEDLKNAVDIWVAKGKYRKLLDLWAKGLSFDWNRLYEDVKPRLISLPTYPFAKERYWVPENKDEFSRDIKENQAATGKKAQTGKGVKHEIDSGFAMDKALVGKVQLIPVWDSVQREKGEIFPAKTDRILIIGGTPDSIAAVCEYYTGAHILNIDIKDSVEQIADKIEGLGTINHIIWMPSDDSLKSLTDDIVIEEQNRGVFQVFRIIKAFIHLNYGNKALGWTVITLQSQPINKNDRVDPTHASIHGLMGSMAKEYSNWKVRLIDMEFGCPWSIEDIFTLLPDQNGDAWCYRNGEWYKQGLVPFNSENLPVQSLYRSGGVYVIIGGAGGIGEVWSEYMIRTYQARIIWIGRREKDEAIEAQINRLAAIGIPPHYITADATDKEALQQAYEEIKQQYQTVNGIIHAAIVLADQSLANMDEGLFRKAVSAKVDVSVRMAQIFKKEPLDFALFFSSVVSNVKSPGQSNYAAGCTFKDAFAHQLEMEWPCRVKVINWGYWGNVGVVASKAYRDRMAQYGVDSIEPPEAMEALEVLLSVPVDRIVFLKTTKASGLVGMKPEKELITIHPKKYMSDVLSTAAANRPSGTIPEYLGLQSIRSEKAGQLKEMDKLLIKLLLSQLRCIGMFTEKRTVIHDFKKKAGLSGLYERWLDESIAVLERNNYIESDGEAYSISTTAVISIQNAWKEWDKRKSQWLNDPDIKARVVLLEAVLKSLPQILTGKCPSTDIIFPESSFELVEGIYKNNLISDYFNEVLADTAADYIKELVKQDPSAKIRIIEVGAGTGGTSAMVLEKLKPYKSNIQEYCYSDISKSFLIYGEKEYGPENAYLTYKLFNVELPISGQKIGDGYDIAIATNVLHATKNIRQTLRNLKAVLRGNGLVLINEIADNLLFLHLTFGLLEGWWLYEDSELRIPGCPGLYPEKWKSVLESEGFRSVSYPAMTDHGLGQTIIAAESDGVVRQKQKIISSALPAERPSSVIVKSTLKDARPGKAPAGQGENSIVQTAGILPVNNNVTDKMSKDYVRETIIEKLSEALRVDANTIDEDEPFADYGLDSITGIHLVQAINETMTIELKTTRLFDHSSVNKLAEYILSEYKNIPSKVFSLNMEKKNMIQAGGAFDEKEESPIVPHMKKYIRVKKPFLLDHRKRADDLCNSIQKEPIAIIGMSGRFAKSETVDELWAHLSNGTNLIGEVARWDLSRCFPEGTKYCNYGSFLDDIDKFDPLFFGISGLEATYMDPQQRLFLEESWKALEDAGYAGKGTQERLCGVYVGCGGGDYRQLFENNPNPPAQSFWGNMSSVVPARISYYLNLHGPAIAVDTACSSSLTAIHLACQGLWTGETEMALAGGVLIQCTPWLYAAQTRAGMLSLTGRCHAFDEKADGFVPGEGVGVVVLKRLKEAVCDGDHIYGVIRGSGINQDGTTNGITAPSAKSQERLEHYVYDNFHINPEQIQMVEAHGTGTKLGDPIEFEALAKSFGNRTGKKGYCALGSIKTNIGHTQTAAGVAGVIKILLSLQHKKIPPTLNFSRSNPEIEFEESPFYINTELKNWDTENNLKRCAAVSSFGASGTNAHMVIEEAPGIERRHSPKPAYLLVLSARTHEQLRKQAEQLSEFCKKEQDLDCGNMSYTLMVGRKHLKHRLACIISSNQEATEVLTNWLNNGKTPQIYIADLNMNEYREQPALKRYANQCIENLQNTCDTSGYLEQLSSIAELYSQGYELEYERLFMNDHYCRISLPTYPFTKECYWVREEYAKPQIPADGDEIHPSLNRSIPSSQKEYGTMVLESFWKEKPVDEQTALVEYSQRLVVLCELDKLSVEELETQVKGVRFLTLEANGENIGGRFKKYTAKIFDEIRNILKNTPTEAVLIQVLIGQKAEKKIYSALSGLLKTARLENPKCLGQIIELEDEDILSTIDKLQEEGRSPFDSHVSYRNNIRYIKDWRETPASKTALEVPWKDGGVYLITGGAGGLGLIFAREIVQKTDNITLILVGRSSQEVNRLHLPEGLEKYRAQIVYKQVDVADFNAVTGLIKDILNDFGNLNGVIHSAGVIRDSFIINKNGEEITEVLRPKVTGLVNLDEATRDLSLDFFVMFSSISATMGSVGQADYSAANAFMDAYASYRNDLAASNQRSGQTLSINWPLWKDGGMRADEATEGATRQNTGITAMITAEGIQAFYRAMGSGKENIMVLNGDILRIQKYLSGNTVKSQLQQTPGVVPQDDVMTLKEKINYQIKALFGEITELSTDKIDIREPLESYGIDSIMITRLNEKLAEIFGELSKTLFYEYRNLEGLVNYLVAEYPQECMKWSGIKKQSETAVWIMPESMDSGFESHSQIDFSNNKEGQQDLKAITDIREGDDREPIAIIGLSGRYPQAGTLDDYWTNLEGGKDCITEIPKERWSMEEYFNPNPQEALSQGKSYGKSGGFLEEYADFDPLFFNISPRDAINIDPQERLFLEECWNVLEDAGYTRERIEVMYKGKVGVFTGITKTGYNLYCQDSWKQDGQAFPYSLLGSAANRVSYLLNLKGPSIPVDTMCSSSLTALHEACQHIYRDECEMAIAGGVNIYHHPLSYVQLSMLRMLSTDGRCKSFGEGGNGFVPGEGVGAVLLKRLSKAVADGDHIYAVVRSTSINHGGKTNGYTVPNPTAQGEVIRAALDRAGLNSRMVSYIEAHGTGTELGDPIEIAGLTQAFRKDTSDTGFCAIGSAKSNIGHLEAAAGIAGITKILLQMKHGKIVPSLHARKLNPNIDFEKTPFVVQQELGLWKRPVITANGKTTEYPRIAGISSFGAGGANAHVVIEEYIQKGLETAHSLSTGTYPVIIVLSAKNEDRLKERATLLLDAIQKGKFSDLVLPDIAYTLQIGREAMDERLAFTVDTIHELEKKLKSFTSDNHCGQDMYRGQVKQNKEAVQVFAKDEELQEAIDKWIQRKKYTKLMELWVKGLSLNWDKLYSRAKPHIMSLPAYPFAREQYWPCDTNKQAVELSRTKNTLPGVHDNYMFDKAFYEELIDRVIHDDINIDDAVKKAKSHN